MNYDALESHSREAFFASTTRCSLCEIARILGNHARLLLDLLYFPQPLFLVWASRFLQHRFASDEPVPGLSQQFAARRRLHLLKEIALNRNRWSIPATCCFPRNRSCSSDVLVSRFLLPVALAAAESISKIYRTQEDPFEQSHSQASLGWRS
jgi:hypothetical protein